VLIWEFARTHQFAIVTKDRDFREFSLDLGSPPKLIWIGLGNCSTKHIEHVLRREATRIVDFIAKTGSSALIIGR
jgi:predicted nuclease of predicted toxin-antitoxin system